MGNDLISQFVESDVIDSLGIFISKSEADSQSVAKVSTVLGADGAFKELCDGNAEYEEKLLNSFKKNLALLIEKTWVEKSDEDIKEKVLYKLDEYCSDFSDRKYFSVYRKFFEIIGDVVYLMFGRQAKGDDFMEYALRIDPELGIFWWLVSALPQDGTEINWSEEKIRLALLLGMTFLANY